VQSVFRSAARRRVSSLVGTAERRATRRAGRAIRATGAGRTPGGRGSSGGKRHAWVRNGLVVSELAFACILLVGAGLLIRSFLRVLDVNLGFQPERAATLRIDPSFRISSSAQQNSFIDDVLNRARSVPGIVAAGITDVLPLRDDRSWAVSVRGQIYEKGHQQERWTDPLT
jgi:hypothetical protein